MKALNLEQQFEVNGGKVNIVKEPNIIGPFIPYIRNELFKKTTPKSGHDWWINNCPKCY